MMNPAEFANIARSEKDFWWYRGMRSILFRLMDPYMAGRTVRRALDAGCGTGYMAHVLASERGWPMVALDLDREGLRYARLNCVERTVQGDMTRLPFAGGAFDVVMSLDALVHIPQGEESTVVRELARVVTPGGLLVLRAAAFNALRSRHSAFVMETQRYSRAKLIKLVTDTGMRVLRCTYANSLLLPLALAKFRIWEPLRRAPVASGVEPVAPWLDRLLHAPLAFEAGWLGSGHDLPLGQTVVLVGEKAA
ncbi:MAG TPA: class I SAM-dependent methyltransferase [Bryobacteraceae bacterium]|nr:class I SAM-dependent methyltransferase [Bryobacteraceae bacterium]